MKILGLTGSIATGKSFVAEKFRQNNIPVFSSDKEVGLLIQKNEIVNMIKVFDEINVSVEEDKINKDVLSKIVFKNKNALNILEDLLYPFLNKAREDFLFQNSNEKTVLLEIPLLYEKNFQSLCNKVITTYCSEATQKDRALRRKNIDQERLEFIINQQMPGNLKARLTDYLVYTELSSQYTELQLKQIFYKEGIL